MYNEERLARLFIPVGFRVRVEVEGPVSWVIVSRGGVDLIAAHGIPERVAWRDLAQGLMMARYPTVFVNRVDLQGRPRVR